MILLECEQNRVNAAITSLLSITDKIKENPHYKQTSLISHFLYYGNNEKLDEICEYNPTFCEYKHTSKFYKSEVILYGLIEERIINDRKFKMYHEIWTPIPKEYYRYRYENINLSLSSAVNKKFIVPKTLSYSFIAIEDVKCAPIQFNINKTLGKIDLFNEKNLKRQIKTIFTKLDIELLYKSKIEEKLLNFINNVKDINIEVKQIKEEMSKYEFIGRCDLSQDD